MNINLMESNKTLFRARYDNYLRLLRNRKIDEVNSIPIEFRTTEVWDELIKIDYKFKAHVPRKTYTIEEILQEDSLLPENKE